MSDYSKLLEFMKSEGLRKFLEEENRTHEEIEAFKKDLEELAITIDIKTSTDKKEAEKLDCIKAENYVMSNSKISNTLAKYDLDNFKDAGVRVSPRKAKRETITTVNIDYDSENIVIADKDKRFNAYDRVVHDSVCSLNVAGNSNFTADRVYRAMNGLNDKEKPSDKIAKEITESIDKMSRIRCKINCTEEMKSRGIDKAEIEGYILATEKITLESGGQTFEGYRLLSSPMLYRYASEIKQVITVPMELLNTKEIQRNTKENIVLRAYIIKRIEVMKGKTKQSNCILLESVFEELDLISPTKEKSKKIRDSIENLLKNYEETEYIKGFEFYKQGRTIKGIKIKY